MPGKFTMNAKTNPIKKLLEHIKEKGSLQDRNDNSHYYELDGSIVDAAVGFLEEYEYTIDEAIDEEDEREAFVNRIEALITP